MAEIPILGISTNTVLDFIELLPRTMIGDIAVDTAIEQEHFDRVETTEHPVQAGAAITDHAYKVPSEITLRCGWSNSSLNAALDIISTFISNGSLAADYIGGIYSRLLALMEAREVVSVTTIRRTYENMVLVALGVQTDQTTGHALMVEATLREIIIVETSSSTLPPQESQSIPESTAEVQNTGTTQIKAAIPASGGSLPPSKWGPSLISQ